MRLWFSMIFHCHQLSRWLGKLERDFYILKYNSRSTTISQTTLKSLQVRNWKMLLLFSNPWRQDWDMEPCSQRFEFLKDKFKNMFSWGSSSCNNETGFESHWPRNCWHLQLYCKVNECKEGLNLIDGLLFVPQGRSYLLSRLLSFCIGQAKRRPALERDGVSSGNV